MHIALVIFFPAMAQDSQNYVSLLLTACCYYCWLLTACAGSDNVSLYYKIMQAGSGLQFFQPPHTTTQPKKNPGKRDCLDEPVKKKKNRYYQQQTRVHGILFMDYHVLKDNLFFLSIGLILSLCIGHRIPLEILAVTFHTLVGEVINQAVMDHYYPTSPRRVQIRYLYSRGPVRQVCLLLTNQVTGFPAPILFCFAYFCHTFPVNNCREICQHGHKNLACWIINLL